MPIAYYSFLCIFDGFGTCLVGTATSVSGCEKNCEAKSWKASASSRALPGPTPGPTQGPGLGGPAQPWPRRGRWPSKTSLRSLFRRH